MGWEIEKMKKIFLEFSLSLPGFITYGCIGFLVLLCICLKCCCYFVCTEPDPDRKSRSTSKGGSKKMKKVDSFADKVRQMPAIAKFRNVAQKNVNIQRLAALSSAMKPKRRPRDKL